MLLACTRVRLPQVGHAACLRSANLYRRPLHASTTLRFESVEEIRRKMNGQVEAQKFRQQLSEPDRIVGRAFAELEEESRRKMEWKTKMGYLSEKERRELEEQKQEMASLGLDPNKGRWSDYLKKKKFTPKEKKGMPEFRAGASMQSLLAKVKHAKSSGKKPKKK